MTLILFLVAAALLLGLGQAFNYVFRRLRQPPVIGEILAGLILGPTIFGFFLPGLQEAIFSDPSVSVMLDALYELGLLLLMFCSGVEMRGGFPREERRPAIAITLAGTLLPFAAGLAVVRLIDIEPLMGPAGHPGAFMLVYGIAIAITSIPVISRIMGDLGVLGTPFSAIVLSAAVVEDIILYVVLSVALGLVAAAHGDAFGLLHLLGIPGDSPGRIVFHLLTPLIFFGLALAVGPALFSRLTRARLNFVKKANQNAYFLVFLLATTALGAFIDVAPMLGSFIAGFVVGRSMTPDGENAAAEIRAFSYAFFIPIYFALVGLQLDLIRDLNLVSFAVLLLLACTVKSLSVFGAARLAGESSLGSVNLAVAMNARGGPGIVLASVAFGAGIVSDEMYTNLVMLAIATSLIAGSWLDLVVRRGWPLR